MDDEIIIPNIPPLGLHLATLDRFYPYPLRGTHIHKEIELVYVSVGQITCTIGDDTLTLGMGDVLFIGSQAVHRLVPCDDTAVYSYIQFDMADCLQQLFHLPNKCFFAFMSERLSAPYHCVAHDDPLSGVFRAMLDENQTRLPYYEELINTQQMQLMLYLFRSGIFPDFNALNHNRAVRRLQPAIDYVEANFHRKLTVEEAADSLHMSKFAFCKLFKRATGTTFMEYLHFRRLYHAEQLLTTTDKSISEIALDSGFTSVQYFNYFFKEKRRCTPTEYRKSYR